MLTSAATPTVTPDLGEVEVITGWRAARAACMARHPSNFGKSKPEATNTPLNRESERERERRKAWSEYYTD